LIFESDLDKVKVNHRAEYLGQRSERFFSLDYIQSGRLKQRNIVNMYVRSGQIR